MPLVCINGQFADERKPVLLASNRSYRYGDGLFETMVLENGEILLKQLHFERLLKGLSILQIRTPPSFTIELLEDQVCILCDKNDCRDLARVRLSVFRENDSAGYLIEASTLEPAIRADKNGLIIDIYPHARKAIDIFSNLKTANYLPYAMAAKYAKDHQLDDCLILNTNGNIADSSIANVYIMKNGKIITPALSEGCVEGVIRRWLITGWQKTGLECIESIVTPKDLEHADAVFLTNAIRGIRWVKQYRDHYYRAPNNSALDLF